MVNLDVRSDPVPTALVEPELADLLVEYLDQLGVEYVFCVPGGAIEPLYNALARSDLVGAEALVRWNHPTDGILGPNVFIPLAEESGLINRLSDWVLEQGAGQLHEWLSAGYKLTLALNLSVKDLMAEQLHE